MLRTTWRKLETESKDGLWHRTMAKASGQQQLPVPTATAPVFELTLGEGAAAMQPPYPTNMALWQRRPGSVVHHSDQGSQYTSYAFGKRCREMGVAPPMGSVGDCFDNAMAESFFATLECEIIDRRVFRTQVEARMAIFEYIEGCYNPHRRHSGLGYLSPLNFREEQSTSCLSAKL